MPGPVLVFHMNHPSYFPHLTTRGPEALEVLTGPGSYRYKMGKSEFKSR